MALDVVGTINANDLQAEELRRIVRGVAVEGTLKVGDFAVTQNGTPNMSVNVAAGEAFVEGDESTAQGLYYVRNGATVNVAVSAASSSNPRKDIVVLRVRDAQYSGATNAAALEVIAGTPAASPSAPATPSNALKLAELTVGQSASSVVTANIAGTRYRSSNVDHQYLVNDATTVGIIGSNVTIFSGTVTKPTHWVEYDLHIHGRMVFETTASAGAHNRFTTMSQVPSGTERNQGRVSMIGVQTGVSALFQDPVDVVVNGLTVDTTFRYQATVTDGGGGNVVRRLVIATLNRTR